MISPTMPLPEVLMTVAVGVGMVIAGYIVGAWTLHAQLHAAYRDPLTGLPSRAVFEQQMSAATRTGRGVTVVLADVVGLHAVNNLLGYAAGDQYLCAVADRLRQATPAGGRVYRLGGDEFVMLIPTRRPGIEQSLVTALRAAMAGRARIGDCLIQPRASIGIASGTGASMRVLACADAALLAAKKHRDGQPVVYDPDRDGRPEPDTARPRHRRRDRSAPATPRPTTSHPGAPIAEQGRGLSETGQGEQEMVAVLWTLPDARTIAHALRYATGQITHSPALDGGSHCAPSYAFARLADQLQALIDEATALHRSPPPTACADIGAATTVPRPDTRSNHDEQ